MTFVLTAPSSISSRPQPLPRGRWLSWTIVFALFLSAALVGIEAWQMWHVRDASLRSAKIVTAGLAESLSQQIETTLKTADTVVGSLVQRVEVEGVSPETVTSLYGLMTSLAARAAGHPRDGPHRQRRQRHRQIPGAASGRHELPRARLFPLSQEPQHARRLHRSAGQKQNRRLAQHHGVAPGQRPQWRLCRRRGDQRVDGLLPQAVRFGPQLKAGGSITLVSDDGMLLAAARRRSAMANSRR